VEVIESRLEGSSDKIFRVISSLVPQLIYLRPLKLQ